MWDNAEQRLHSSDFAESYMVERVDLAYYMEEGDKTYYTID